MHATGSASVFDVKGRGGAVVALQDGQGIGILVRRHGDPAFGRRTFYTTVALWPCPPLTLSLLMKLIAWTEIVIAFPVHLQKHQQQWQGNGHAELSN